MKFASLLFGISLIVSANGVKAADSMEGMDMKSHAQPMGQSHKAQGTINKVDKAAGKVNISHGPVSSLNWSSMTMSFAVKDQAMLSSLKPGDKVNFEIVKEPDGSFSISKAAPVK